MKIDIGKLKQVPENMKNSPELELCVYGEIPEEISEWISFHKLFTYQKDKYTNIVLKDVDLNELFIAPTKYTFMDGFSPNLNKKLHIGHFSNFVLAKAFYNMDVCLNSISIYGDAHAGELPKEEAVPLINNFCEDFQFKAHKEYFASEMKYEGSLIYDESEGEYAGTKIFNVGEEKVVGIKSNGATTYFYQDVSLIELLTSSYKNISVLYLTGAEQENHFRLLKILYPNIHHVPLGLVKVSGKKMGTRFGNVILIEDFLKEMRDELSTHNLKLVYNIFAGYILKATPESDKNINMDMLTNPKNSPGLYLSYTMARLDSAGVNYGHYHHATDFISSELKFAYMKAQCYLKPSILFDALYQHCNKINALYVTHQIKNSAENNDMFGILLADLLIGIERLGMFHVNKV